MNYLKNIKTWLGNNIWAIHAGNLAVLMLGMFGSFVLATFLYAALIVLAFTDLEDL